MNKEHNLFKKKLNQKEEKSLKGKTEEEIKELNKFVYNCKCMPLGGKPYCGNCQRKVIDFMNRYGLGILMQDDIIEELRKGIPKIKSESFKLGYQSAKVQTIKEVEDMIENRRKALLIPTITNNYYIIGINDLAMWLRDDLKQQIEKLGG